MATNEGVATARKRSAPRVPSARLPAKPHAPLLAYMLHRYDWSETSLIVELFTRAQGRVVVVAKGAKRPTSNFRAVLLPFAPLHALLGKTPADAQAEIHNLRGAEWAGGAPLLSGAALLSGFYLNELLMKLLARQDAYPRLFDAYADTLAALALEQDDAAALRAFELVLLRELGWLPDLSTATLTAEPVRADARYTLDAEAGVVLAGKGSLQSNAHNIAQGKAQNDAQNNAQNSVQGSVQGITGADCTALEAALVHAASSGSPVALRAACAPLAGGLRGPLRDLLHYHLGGSPLRTRQVWQGVQRLSDTRLLA